MTQRISHASAEGRRERSLRFVSSTSTRARLDVAREFLTSRPSHSEILIVGATRGAADDLARAACAGIGATFGWHRFSLLQLASRLALATLAHKVLSRALWLLGIDVPTRM